MAVARALILASIATCARALNISQTHKKSDTKKWDPWNDEYSVSAIYSGFDNIPPCDCTCCTMQPSDEERWTRKVNKEGGTIRGCGPIYYSQTPPDQPACPALQQNEGMYCKMPKPDPMLTSAIGGNLGSNGQIDIARFCLNGCTPSTQDKVNYVGGAQCIPVTLHVLEALGVPPDPVAQSAVQAEEEAKDGEKGEEVQPTEEVAASEEVAANATSFLSKAAKAK